MNELKNPIETIIKMIDQVEEKIGNIIFVEQFFFQFWNKLEMICFSSCLLFVTISSLVLFTYPRSYYKSL